MKMGPTAALLRQLPLPLPRLPLLLQAASPSAPWDAVSGMAGGLWTPRANSGSPHILLMPATSAAPWCKKKERPHDDARRAQELGVGHLAAARRLQSQNLEQVPASPGHAEQEEEEEGPGPETEPELELAPVLALLL